MALSSIITKKRVSRITNDCFVLFNTLLFVFMCTFVYQERFVKYLGNERNIEFFIYAVLIIIFIIGLWLQFRKLFFPLPIVVMIELGILVHFAGGLIFIDGHRLYDQYLLGIRYDKYVHLINAFAVTMLIQNIFIVSRLKLRYLRDVIVFFVVLGLGAILEITEYIVTRHVIYNGVGGYDNNMQDLIANACGVFLCLLVWRLGAWRLINDR